MYKWILLIIICLAQMCSDRVSGTVTDTNSGTIAGLAMNKKNIYKDSIVISLYSKDTVVTIYTSSDGHFQFDSLPAGVYSLGIYKDSVLIGKETNIYLGVNEKKTILIQVIIVINQIFNVTYIDNRQTVTINNFYFIDSLGTITQDENGKIIATFPEKDSVYLTLITKNSEKNDSLKLVFIKNNDGTFSCLPIVSTPTFVITDGETIQNTGSGSDSVSAIIHGNIFD